MFIISKFKILLVLLFLIITGNAAAFEKNVVKSLNFKLYYSAGGEKIAKNIILYAENNLGNIENFLGTRLVEKIDIFLLESNEYSNAEVAQRNGTIILTNSEIKIFYEGNILNAQFQLKKQLSEILIYNMLYGNTIKDRLKNNREVNIQSWFIKGLALFVANKNEVNTGKLADYFENRIKLNFNLLSEKETEEIGFSVVKFLNDTFGSTKLKQILFYTRLAGNTDFAFKVVLNNSSEKIIEKWFYSEKYYYLQNSKLRLPNEPEPISTKLKNSEIVDMKFNNGKQCIDFLVKSELCIEIFNYNFDRKQSKLVFKLNQISSNFTFNFTHAGKRYILSKSDGYSSRIMLIENGKIINNINIAFANIYKISEYNGGYLILAQKNYRTGLYFFKNFDEKELTNVSQFEFDLNDFVTSGNDEVFVTGISNEKYCIFNLKTKKNIYCSVNLISNLSLYNDSFLSFLSFSKGIQSGMIVNISDTSKHYRVTNYNRSISYYDYSPELQMVAELINYDKKNYVVISDATVKEIYFDDIYKSKITKDTSLNEPKTPENNDTLRYFITGFEYRKDEKKLSETEIYNRVSFPIKLKEYKIFKYEFKPSFMKIGFTNEMYQNKEFAYFFPVNQGLNNGVNVIIGCGIIEIYKKYTFEGNLRQPLRNKGLDMDFTFFTYKKNGFYGVKFYLNNFQEELYNSPEKFHNGELRFLTNKKLNYKITNTIETGIRQDLKINTSVSEDNIKKSEVRIVQPFFITFTKFEIFKKNKLNYKNSLNIETIIKLSKPINRAGLNNVFKFMLNNNQIFYRVIKISAQIVFATSPSYQKTVFLMGGQSNWLKPDIGNARLHDSLHTLMFSAVEDFEGFPLNYLSGNSYNINKLKIVLPLNPVLSFYSFNQNLFKFLTLKGVFNIGTVWYGKNPFSVTNPENRTITETGSMTITNFTYKNPLIWSWCTGINSVLLGYNFGVDFSKGYNERGNIGRFISFTLGKEI